MKKIKKIKKMKWFYATIVLAILGTSLLSYGVYSSNISSHTITEQDGTYQSEPIDDPFKDSLHIKEIVPSIFGITDFDPDAIDQIQSEQQGMLNHLIGFNPSSGNDNIMKQTCNNDREPFNGFQIAIAKKGNPTEPLYLGIMDGHNADPTNPNYWDAVGVLYPSQLPQSDTFYWVGFEAYLPQIIARDNFGIASFSAEAGYPNNYWCWARNDNNPYDRGSAKWWDGDSWEDPSGNPLMDFCFVTYTIPNGGGDPPDITIATTYNVISMFGGLSLIAAVATGSKFYFFM